MTELHVVGEHYVCGDKDCNEVDPSEFFNDKSRPNGKSFYCKACLKKHRNRRAREAKNALTAAQVSSGWNAIRSISTCIGMAIFGLRAISNDHYKTIFLTRSKEMEKLIDEDMEFVIKKLISIESLLLWALEREKEENENAKEIKGNDDG